MNFTNEGIAYKPRAFEILAHETHFYNVLDLTLSLNSDFGLFHCFFSLCDEFNDLSLLVFVGVGAFGHKERSQDADECIYNEENKIFHDFVQ